MVTHSHILAWEIPQIEKPGGLQSMGITSVGQDLLNKKKQQFLTLPSKPNQTVPIINCSCGNWPNSTLNPIRCYVHLRKIQLWKKCTYILYNMCPHAHTFYPLSFSLLDIPQKSGCKDHHWVLLILWRIRNNLRKMSTCTHTHNTESTIHHFSSVQSLSRVQLPATPWAAACQASLSIINSQSLLKLMSMDMRWWCHPTISSSVVPFSSHLQSYPASGSFPMSQFFTSGGQSIGASASASVLPMNIHGWFPLGWTGWISLQSEGLSRVFSNTTVQKHQFFGAQLSL